MAVVVGVCPGFVGNRMLVRRSEQMDRVLLEGALPQEIDGALTSFGFRMGPCAMSDLAGLDVSWRARKAAGKRAPAADALCEAGRFGQKTGRGYYIYQDGARSGVIDAAVEAMLRGPMFYADRIGLKQVANDLERMADEIGDETMRPPRLLRDLAAKGRGFHSLGEAGPET